MRQNDEKKNLVLESPPSNHYCFTLCLQNPSYWANNLLNSNLATFTPLDAPWVLTPLKGLDRLTTIIRLVFVRSPLDPTPTQQKVREHLLRDLEISLFAKASNNPRLFSYTIIPLSIHFRIGIYVVPIVYSHIGPKL